MEQNSSKIKDQLNNEKIMKVIPEVWEKKNIFALEEEACVLEEKKYSRRTADMNRGTLITEVTKSW